MKVIIKLNVVAERVSVRMMQQQERGSEKEVMVYTVVRHCQHQQQKQITIEIPAKISYRLSVKCNKNTFAITWQTSRTVSRGLRLPANTLPASDAVNLKIRMTLQIKFVQR